MRAKKISRFEHTEGEDAIHRYGGIADRSAALENGPLNVMEIGLFIPG
jgi:hypothetical protein